MSDVPVQLIVAAFQDEKTAKEALKGLKQAQREKMIKIDNAAVLRKDQKGKLHISETADMGGGKGAALGGVTGAVVGLLAGPMLIVPVAVGALVGGLTAKLRDSGFSDERLKMLGEGLKPGSSAIVAVVEHRWVGEVEKALEEAGADAMTQALSADIAAQLEKEHEVAYTAIASQEGLALGRVAAGQGEVEGSSLLVTEEGIQESQFVATKEGFAVLSVTEDESGTTVMGVVAAAGEDETGDQEGKPAGQ